MSQQPLTDFGGFAPAIDHRLEVATEMSPAELATPNPIVALEPITDDNLGGGSPQDRLGNRGTPRRGDGKDRRQSP